MSAGWQASGWSDWGRAPESADDDFDADFDVNAVVEHNEPTRKKAAGGKKKRKSAKKKGPGGGSGGRRKKG